MNVSHPTGVVRHDAQVNDPQVGQTGRQHQAGDAGWITEVTAIQLKTTTFLVGKERFDLRPLTIRVTRGLDTAQVADQINRLGVSAPPLVV